MSKENELSEADEIMLSWFEAMGESPRGFVVCCVAMIDDELGRLIRSEMDHDGENRIKVIDSIFDPVKGGSLQSIHAKRQIAYAMGWIDDDAYQDIGVLARIRNMFAHERACPTFDDEHIHKLIKKLKYPRYFYEKEDLDDLSQPDHFMMICHVGSDITYDTKGEPFAKTLFLSSVHTIMCNFIEYHNHKKDEH